MRQEPRGTGGYFVRSAEGIRSAIAITKLGPTEYKRRVKEMVEKIRERNRGR